MRNHAVEIHAQNKKKQKQSASDQLTHNSVCCFCLATLCFSSQSIVDEQLPLTFFDFTQCFFMVIGCLVAVGMSAPYTLLVLVPILPLFVWVRQHFLKSSRELKRLDATTRSPVYAHFSSTLSGLMIIRSFHSEAAFIAAFLDKCNANTRCFIKFQISARWFGLRLDLIAASVVACLSLLVVGTRGTMSPADAGFALSYCLQLTALFQWAVRQSAEVETMMTSVERIIEYGELPPEGALVNPDYRPPAGWPSHGEVQFSDYKMRYRKGLDLVLKGVDFTVAPGEKVGVCGRTGAGKSSLFQALLRLVEPAGGAILIDGMEGAKMGLRDLRQGLAIIPQVRRATRGHTHARTVTHVCSLLGKPRHAILSLIPLFCANPFFFRSLFFPFSSCFSQDS